MHRRWMAAAIAALGIACAARAAEPEEKKPEAPRPSPEVEKLNYFAAPWTSEGTMRPGPNGPGQLPCFDSQRRRLPFELNTHVGNVSAPRLDAYRLRVAV